jgi:hypothetical protein
MTGVMYAAIAEQLVTEFGLRVEEEHPAVREFYEGPVPIFKLILAEEDIDAPPVMLVSFHIELESTYAVQWFAKIRHYDHELRIARVYLKDADGASHVGDDAQILRMYMLEQDVISAYIASDKDAHQVAGQEIPTPKPSPLRPVTSYRHAVLEFQRMTKKKGSMSH